MCKSICKILSVVGSKLNPFGKTIMGYNFWIQRGCNVTCELTKERTNDRPVVVEDLSITILNIRSLGSTIERNV